MEELSKNSQHAQELPTVLKQRAQFYREENAKLEAIFKKLKLLNEHGELKLLPTKGAEHMAPKFKQKQLDSNIVSLSHSERLREHNKYVSKIKICIKLYINLNEKLSKEIKNTQWELEQSKSSLGGILSLSNEELKQLEEKSKRYESELLKFEKKYPWLKDPEFKLPNILKETESLKSLREEKRRLINELNVFQDLKPDLKEASEQLINIKNENQQLVNKLLDKNVLD